MTQPLMTLACPLCGSRETRIVFTPPDQAPYQNVICVSCSLVFINPRMTEEDYRRAYEEGFTKAFMKLEGQLDEEAENKAAERKARGIMRYLEAWLPKTGRVFEVGAGYGALLQVVADRGMSVFGIEPDPRAAERARTRGLDVRTNFLEQTLTNWQEGPVDVILMHHVLEHTMDPVAVLQGLKKLAHPQTVLYIGVPNVLKSPFPNEQFFRPAHTFNFSPYTLLCVLEKAGWKALDCDPTKGPLECIAVLQESPRAGSAAESMPLWMRRPSAVLRTIAWSDRKRRTFRWLRKQATASPVRSLLKAVLDRFGYRATSAGFQKKNQG